MNNESDELSPEERRAFSGLTKEKMPPGFLEDRIVTQLKAANVIRAGKPGWLPSYPVVGISFALSLAIFVVGALVGRGISTTPKQPDLPGYMLIVRRSSAESEAGTPAEELQRVKEYSAWARDLGRRGLLIGGEKLKDEGRLLTQANGNATVATPSKPAEGSIAGYFLLPPGDYEQALTIAKTCPHLKHGGTVELRQIERF